MAASFQQGIQALKSGDSLSAIQVFEQVCDETITNTQDRFKAQGWLVQAYLKAGQSSQAEALCQQLIQVDNPKIRQWSAKMLKQLPAQATATYPQSKHTSATALIDASPAAPPHPLVHLTPTEPLSPEAAQQFLEEGIRNLRKRDYRSAIAPLEDFFRGADDSYPNYAWGKNSLAKAYKGNEQYEAAIALCQEMLESDRESTRAWARDFMKTLPRDLINPTPEKDAPTVIDSNGSTDSPDTLSSPRSPLQSKPRPGKFSSSTAPLKPRTASTRTGRSYRQRTATKDLTPQVLSGLAHGCVSLLASVLLIVLFADSIAANLLGFLRMAVPVVILLRTRDPVVKANATEATNYAITTIVLLAISFLGSIFLVLGLVAILLVFWPLFLLIGLPVIIYSIAFSVWPIYAAVVSIRQPGRIVRYPKWLVLRVLDAK
ncbi:MAG: DUF4870 domain-containing protein [Cyanobacteria bacterium P01_F01_bin.116]